MCIYFLKKKSKQKIILCNYINEQALLLTLASEKKLFSRVNYFHLGGQKFATSKVTLLECKGSLFEALLVSDHSQSSDST